MNIEARGNFWRDFSMWLVAGLKVKLCWSITPKLIKAKGNKKRLRFNPRVSGYRCYSFCECHLSRRRPFSRASQDQNAHALTTWPKKIDFQHHYPGVDNNKVRSRSIRTTSRESTTKSTRMIDN